MAVSALMAAISTASTVMTGGTLLGGFLVGGAGTMLTHFLVTTAMGAAINALSPKPDLSGTQGYSIQGTSGAAVDHQIIYGRARVGGVRFHDVSTGDENEFLHRVLGFAGHEVQSFDRIYLNDSYVDVADLDPDGNVSSVVDPDGTTSDRYDGFLRIKIHDGSPTQAADTDLINETASLTDGKWTADHKLSNIAYLYVRFKYDPDSEAFTSGVPTVSAVIKGKKVYDPETSTTYWTDNAALCIRDYISSGYGLNQPDARIDDALVIAAKAVCNQTVEGEARYTCNGAFTTGAQPASILSDLLSSMGGLFWFAQGKWRMKAAAWSPTSLQFNEDDLRSGISLSTRHSRRDNFNKVTGVFSGDETDWQKTDYPAVSSATFLQADNGLENVLDLPLSFTDSSKRAQRIARIALNRNREQLTVSASFGLRAFAAQVGDVIQLSNTRMGWTNKYFEVVNWSFHLTDELDLLVDLVLRETSAAVFTDTNGAVFEQNNTTLPNPRAGLTISGLTVSGGGRTQGDGTFINSGIVSWTKPTSAFIDHYEVEWKPVADSVYNATTTKQTSIEVSPLIDNLQYTFRVRAVSVSGFKGPYTSTTFTGGGDTTAPSLPTSVVATGGYEYITVGWTNPADADLNYVEVWENTVNSTSGATRVGISSGNNFVRTNLGISETRWYFLKSVDYSGNASGFTSGVSATTTFIDDTAFENGVYSLFTDAGLYAIRDVTSLPASGAFVGEKVFNRTDNKLYQWTGTAWELVVAEPDTFIASDKIVANTITGGLLATSGVITNSAQINDAVITNAKIGNAAVDTLKVAGNAITAPYYFANTSTLVKQAYGVTTPSYSSILSFTVATTGSPMFFTINIGAQRVGQPYQGGPWQYLLGTGSAYGHMRLRCTTTGDIPKVISYSLHREVDYKTHGFTARYAPSAGTYSFAIEVAASDGDNFYGINWIAPSVFAIEVKR